MVSACFLLMILVRWVTDTTLTDLSSRTSTASPLSLPTELSTSTLLLTSSSLSSVESLEFPSPIEPATKLSVSSAEWNKIVESLKTAGVSVKDVTFSLKGEVDA